MSNQTTIENIKVMPISAHEIFDYSNMMFFNHFLICLAVMYLIPDFFISETTFALKHLIPIL
jgi:hypothetical protein